MFEKRKRIALNSEAMPDDVYEILNEKALRRKITPFIIELVQDRIKEKELLEKLNVIDAKIDRLTSGNTIIKNSSLEEEVLAEGRLIQAAVVISEIEEEDIVEYDF